MRVNVYSYRVIPSMVAPSMGLPDAKTTRPPVHSYASFAINSA